MNRAQLIGALAWIEGDENFTEETPIAREFTNEEGTATYHVEAKGIALKKVRFKGKDEDIYAIVLQ